MGGDRLESIALQAAASIRSLGTNRAVLAESLTWAALNWLLDAASLWCFIAAFGGYPNPVGLFAAYGIANVIGAIPLTPGGLGIIDTVTPVLLVSFGLTRSVATLGVLAWRLVNFWLPIPTGALAYVSLKVPKGADLRAMRRALADLIPRGSHGQQSPAGDSGAGADRQDGADAGASADRQDGAGAEDRSGREDASVREDGSQHQDRPDLQDGAGHRGEPDRPDGSRPERSGQEVWPPAAGQSGADRRDSRR